MASKFSITAQLNLVGPKNVKQVADKVYKDLSGLQSFSTQIDVGIKPRAIENVDRLSKKLLALKSSLAAVNPDAERLTSTMERLSGVMQSFDKRSLNVAGSLSKTAKSIKESAGTTAVLTNEFERFGAQAALAARRFLAFAAPVGLLFGLASAIREGTKEALDFQNSVVRIAQVTGKTTTELKDLTNEVTRLSTSFGVSSKELVNITQTLAQAGLSARDTRVALDALAKTDLAPSFDGLKDSTEAAIALFGQFGVTADTLEGKLDSLNVVAAKFPVEAKDLTTAIRSSGAAFREAGGSVEELFALFTSVRGKTRESADSIATAFKTIFARLQRPQTIRKIDELIGVDLSENGQFVGPIKAIDKLNRALRDLPDGSLLKARVAEEVGGIRQLSKTIPIIDEYKTTFEALNVAESGKGSLNRDAEKSQESFLRQLKKVKEEFLALFRTIADSSSFKEIIHFMTTAASAAIKLTEALVPLLPILTALTAIKAIPKLGGFLSGFGRFFAHPGSGSFIPGGPGRQGFASGGRIPGSGSGDKIPIAAEPGEFVIKGDSARDIGYTNLIKWNRDGKRGVKDTFLPGFQTGGIIGANAGDVKGNLLKTLTGERRTALVLKMAVELDSLKLNPRIQQQVAAVVRNQISEGVKGPSRKQRKQTGRAQARLDDADKFPPAISLFENQPKLLSAPQSRNFTQSTALANFDPKLRTSQVLSEARRLDTNPDLQRVLENRRGKVLGSGSPASNRGGFFTSNKPSELGLVPEGSIDSFLKAQTAKPINSKKGALALRKGVSDPLERALLDSGVNIPGFNELGLAAEGGRISPPPRKARKFATPPVILPSEFGPSKKDFLQAQSDAELESRGLKPSRKENRFFSRANFSELANSNSRSARVLGKTANFAGRNAGTFLKLGAAAAGGFVLSGGADNLVSNAFGGGQKGQQAASVVQGGISGAVGGALVGGQFAGAPGAAVGATIGALGGAIGALDDFEQKIRDNKLTSDFDKLSLASNEAATNLERLRNKDLDQKARNALGDVFSASATVREDVNTNRKFVGLGNGQFGATTIGGNIGGFFAGLGGLFGDGFSATKNAAAKKGFEDEEKSVNRQALESLNQTSGLRRAAEIKLIGQSKRVGDFQNDSTGQVLISEEAQRRARAKNINGFSDDKARLTAFNQQKQVVEAEIAEREREEIVRKANLKSLHSFNDVLFAQIDVLDKLGQKFKEIALINQSFDNKSNLLLSDSGAANIKSTVLGDSLSNFGSERFGAAARFVGRQVPEAAGPARTLENANDAFESLTKTLPGLIQEFDGTPKSIAEFKAGLTDSLVGVSQDVKASILKQADVLFDNADDTARLKTDSADRISPNDLRDRFLKTFETMLKAIEAPAKALDEESNRLVENLGKFVGLTKGIRESQNQRDTIALQKAQFSAEQKTRRFGGDVTSFLGATAQQTPFLNQQQRLTGLGASSLDPELILQQAQQNRKKAQEAQSRFEEKRNPQDAADLRVFENQVQNSVQALKNLADASNLNASLQQRLGTLQKDQDARLNLGAKFFGGTRQDQRQIGREAQSAIKAISVGTFDRLSQKDRQQAVSFLQNSSDVRLFGGEKTGKDFLNDLIKTSAGGLFNPTGKDQNEADSLNQQIKANFDLAIQAQEKLTTFLQSQQNDFFNILNDNQKAFLQSLGQVVAPGKEFEFPQNKAVVPANQVLPAQAVRGPAVAAAGGGNAGFGGAAPDEVQISDSHAANKFDQGWDKSRIKELRELVKKDPNSGSTNEDGTFVSNRDMIAYYQKDLKRVNTKERSFPVRLDLENSKASAQEQKRLELFNRKQVRIQEAKDKVDIFQRKFDEEGPEGGEGEGDAFISHKTQLAKAKRDLNFLQPKEKPTNQFQRNIANASVAKKFAFAESNERKAASFHAGKLERQINSPGFNRLPDEQRADILENFNKASNRAAGIGKDVQDQIDKNQKGVVPGEGGAPGIDNSKLIPAIQQFNDSVNTLRDPLNAFAAPARDLAAAISTIPHKIDLVGTHKVEVIINGAEILASLNPAMQELAVAAVTKKIREVFPDAGADSLS